MISTQQKPTDEKITKEINSSQAPIWKRKGVLVAVLAVAIAGTIITCQLVPASNNIAAKPDTKQESIKAATYINSAATSPDQAGQSKTGSAPVLTVSVEKVSMNIIERTIAVNGTISAWDPVVVGAEEGGLQVSSIRVDEGAVVEAGQILATLDGSMLRPQIESEIARLKASMASAKKALQPNRVEDIDGLIAAVSQAQANVEDQEAALVQAEANYSNAEINLSRYVTLQRDGAVSMQELENRQTSAKVAAANARSGQKKITAAKFSLEQAQQRLKMAKQGGRVEDIDIANANVAEINGNIKRLNAELDRTIIKAPVKGTIIKRDAHIGEIAPTGRSMFTLARDNRLELRAQVPEADLRGLKHGQKVFISSALTGPGGITGSLREISPQIDADTRLATVRIDVPNTAMVKPGMYAEGRINVGKSAVLALPSQAVISDDDKSIVFVLHKNNVESRTVIVGNRNDNLVEIKSGLQLGEPVVITGAGFLKDGDCVALNNAK